MRPDERGRGRRGCGAGGRLQHRFRDAPAFVKRLLDAGEIGPVTMVRAIGPEVGFWDTSKIQDEWKLDPTQRTTYTQR